jgi:ubiquinone/menaquinone biosynthesis C-methylase UbiE
MTAEVDPAPRREALVERLFGSTVAAMDLLGVYLGDRLGLYRALADHGPLSPAELAAAAGVHERYAREWLEQQAMSRLVDVEDPDVPDAERRYSLDGAHAEVLLDETSLDFAAPFAQFIVGCTRPIESLVEAYRTGGGVPYEDYGEDLHDAQARFTRPMFERLLASEWLPAIPELHQRLASDPPARVADVACGLGRSSVAIARAYPKVSVDGVDLDEASIRKARELLPGSGVEDRVAFHQVDAGDPRLAGRYELVTIFEALHDMPDPVGALRAARALLSDHGYVLVADERTADRFSLEAGDVERLYYGFSILHCLPVGMQGEDPAGTGTVMRAETLRAYATDAGFARVQTAPIENDFWRFYLLSG